jgi:hypothetical protein
MRIRDSAPQIVCPCARKSAPHNSPIHFNSRIRPSAPQDPHLLSSYILRPSAPQNCWAPQEGFSVVLPRFGFARSRAPPLGYHARAGASVVCEGKLRVVPHRQIPVRGAKASTRPLRAKLINVSQILFGASLLWVGGVNHCHLHCRLAKFRGLMRRGKYGAVIG